jgi:uncharacterized iron-regulated membrane protein
MSPEILYWLQIFALIFFNLICVTGIVLLFSIWRTNVILRNKAVSLANDIEVQVNQFSKRSYGLLSDVTEFVLDRVFRRR